MASSELVEEFPLGLLLPKKDIGVERFLQLNPCYDGRGTVIAIFDSGVDPGAAGLQETSSGKRKIIDLIDCSGNGDVDMSVKQTAENGYLKGLSGRKLKIPEEWKNPSGVFRIGLKSAFSLYPEHLKDRVQKERKRHLWDKDHAAHQAKMAKQLSEFECTHQNVTETKEIQAQHQNMKAAVECLANLEKKYNDPGPTYDCILFHDGTAWKACIDTSEAGDLAACKLMGIYKETGQYAHLSSEDLLNYSFNVYDDGATLSIVTNCSPHGTHVASITSANFKDTPDLNGIAPGAQIISMQIGNTKIGSMETGVSIMRAVKAAVDNRVDLINMSYGEAVKWPNAGQVIKNINALSMKHGIIVVSSAGNNGPALTTLGSPGGTSEGVVGIGAHVTPEMMMAEYSLREKMPPLQYTWSSRGPCSDGSLGVCVVAPGAAITSVPNWTLRTNQLMNGTSMSSPNACGGLAVLLSALKEKSVTYSPWSVRMAIENTAIKVAGSCELDQGYGLLQVDQAFELLNSGKCPWVNDAWLKVDCGQSRRGIYIRDRLSVSRSDHQYTATIIPKFPEDAAKSKQLDLDVKLALCCTAPWIRIPKMLALANMARTISIALATDGLSEGSYYEEVRGYDVACPAFGPVVRIPIIVIKPKILCNDENDADLGNIVMKCGHVERRFFVVPQGATWAGISLMGSKTDMDCRYIIHAIQLSKERSFCDGEFRCTLNVKGGMKSRKIFPVLGGETIEVCIAKWWTDIGTTTLAAKMTFHGIKPSVEQVVVNGAEGFEMMSLHSLCSHTDVQPTALLTHHYIPLTPRENQIKPLGERDVVLDGKQLLELVMTYSFSLPKAAEVTPVAPLFHDLLYESAFDSQFWMLFDCNKQLLKSGDAFTLKYKYNVKLEKGDYVIKFQLRHSNAARLEAFKDMVLCLSVKLPSSIALDVFSQRRSVTNEKGKGKFSSKLLHQGDNCLVYFGTIADEKLPKNVKPGHYLTGSVTYASGEAVKKAVKYQLKWLPPPSKFQDSSKAKKAAASKEPVLVEYKDAQRDFIASWIGKLDGKEEQADLIKQYPNDDVILTSYLNSLDASKDRAKHIETIVSTSTRIISLVDSNSLAAYFGVKHDGLPAALQEKVEKERLKSNLTNACQKKVIALAQRIVAKSNAAGMPDECNAEVADAQDMEDTFELLLKWTDQDDTKALLAVANHSLAKGHYGRSLKAIMKLIEDSSPNRLHDDLLLTLCEKLDLGHVVDYLRNWSQLKYPAHFATF